MVVANVAGERRAAELAGWARAHWGLDAEFLVSPRAELGVTNGYTRPEALGVDRWLGLTAAKSLVTGAVLVVDCGTAVTVDVLDADGRHRGGLIAPGLDMMREALRTGTRIPPFEDTHFSLDFGVDTASGISAGIMHSISGMVEKALRSARVVVCEEPQVILTGSGAAALSNALEGSLPLRVEPELVMRGLYLSAAEKEK
jgi:type III pantothenate kinase